MPTVFSLYAKAYTNIWDAGGLKGMDMTQTSERLHTLITSPTTRKFQHDKVAHFTVGRKHPDEKDGNHIASCQPPPSTTSTQCEGLQQHA